MYLFSSSLPVLPPQLHQHPSRSFQEHCLFVVRWTRLDYDGGGSTTEKAAGLRLCGSVPPQRLYCHLILVRATNLFPPSFAASSDLSPKENSREPNLFSDAAMPRASSATALLLAFFAILAAALYGPVKQRLLVFGLTRPKSPSNRHGAQPLRFIDDTAHCEDLHHHLPSNSLFAVCENDERRRYSWFPGIATLNASGFHRYSPGGITVIDVASFASRRLELAGFSGPFATHGIDLFSPQDDPETVYIFAINHLPNPDYWDVQPSPTSSTHKVRSQVELFHHRIGTTKARHLRSIQHPLIKTPNDIYATSPTSFYVTNDHYYREGALRGLEDLLTLQTAPWSDIVHIDVTSSAVRSPDEGVSALVALQELHNNNGLGHTTSQRPQDVITTDATGGLVTRLRRTTDPSAPKTLVVQEHVQMQTTLDNPSFFEDLYATPDNNATGLILAGMARAIDIGSAAKDPKFPMPVAVWHLLYNGNEENMTSRSDPRLIFQDNGLSVHTASAAVLVGIDPKVNDDKKQGWLFVTGFFTRSIAVAKIDL